MLIARPQTVRPIFLLSLTGLFGVGAALVFDSGDQGFAPLPRVGLFPGEVVIKRPQHVAVAPDPARRVEVDGFEGTDEGPAQTESIGDGRVNVRGRAHAVLDEPERLAEERALKTVDYESVDLARCADGLLPHGCHQDSCACNCLRVGPGARERSPPAG